MNNGGPGPAAPNSRGKSSGYNIRGQQGRVIDGLGQAIVGGRYQPGAILPREAELIDEYGVSRTSVREAMKVLAAKGLVETRQRVGTRVRPRELWSAFDSDLLTWHLAQGLGGDAMRDLVELRQILEPAAAKLAAVRATMPDLRRLEHAHAEMAAKVDFPDQYAASDVEFHMAVYAACHNDLLQRFGQLVADFMRLTFEVQQNAQHNHFDFAADARSHREVLTAITSGDPTAATDAMLAVVLEGKTALIEALGQVDDRASADRR
ncbi:FadR family transcriptional regulator [Diaminobutyricibacter tongyongensis]|uniref:FadR family transcriptional regulator n=2 Tax=Leifsonia tongyongensis TaxID=1268043 RepID=A0A6L9XTW3_9MICO|nr:FadR family transcriptional regulator [Diaminobutyricibacter tongyongensis]